MFRHRTHRRTLAASSPAFLGTQLCALLLVMILGGMPLVEVHAHAGSDHPHVHDADHRAPTDHHFGTMTEEGSLLLHVHDSTVVTQALPDVEAITLVDPRLHSTQVLPPAAGRSTGPPAPPRRPPIA